jgi:hypothetical protein
VARTETLAEKPEGLTFRSDFLFEDEEGDLLAAIEPLEFHSITFRTLKSEQGVA